MSIAVSAIGSRLLLVDGHAYAYRAFHAIRQLTSPDGSATNAIFGFVKMVSRMFHILKPTHVAVLWDGGLAAVRMRVWPEYKQQRPPMPDSLSVQIDEIGTWLKARGVASFCEDGVEADDVIAKFARLAERDGMSVVIASSDKDFMQLVSDRVGLFNPNDKSEKVWTGEDVRAKTGVAPGQIVDWLSLIGDAVDNIPGVPGVGPKTATDLLQQFGSIDGLLERKDEVTSERIRQRLTEAAPAVRRNQELIRLADLGPEVRLDDLRLGQGDDSILRGLYEKWGFRQLRAELDKTAQETPALL